MRVSLRYRLLIVPFLLLLGTALATAYAAFHAARTADERIAGRVDAIVRTLRGPPMFPLTLPVLLQMQNLTGAEYAVGNLNTFGAIPVVEEYREHPVELPPTHPNAGVVAVLYFPEAIRREEVRDAVRPVLLLGLGAGVATTVLSLLMGARLVRRIRAVEAGTRAVAAGQFEPLPLPPSNDELRDLVCSVNEMARRLAENVETLKNTERLRLLGQVSGGLAHQLRNAASGARLALQLFDAADPEPLQVAQRQLQRMESILKRFLELGQPEQLKIVLVDLCDLVKRAIALQRPQAEHLGVTLSAECSIPCPRCLDAEQFEHLLENLLLNAMEAAGADGTVRVILTADRIEVIDSGPGPSAAIAARLFEPFATAKPGGIGLGLVVARQVAEAHGATLEWSRRDGKTVFAIDFDS